MKTKVIPFDLETAKKIQAGEINGRIVAENIKGILFPIRIICYDAKNMFPIVGLALDPSGNEYTIMFGESGTNLDDVSIHIELPEKISESGPFDQIIPNPNHRSGVMGDYRFATKQDIEAGVVTSEETPKLNDITTSEGFCRTFQKHEFKVGDKIRVNFPLERLSEMMINGCYQGKILTINQVTNYCVRASSKEVKEHCFTFDEIEPYEKKHELKSFDKVLVRDYDNTTWRVSFFSHTSGNMYICVGGAWMQCISYEGNEHLTGTTDKPKEK